MSINESLKFWTSWSAKDKQKLLGELEKATDAPAGGAALTQYQCDPVAYAETVLHLSPWPGRSVAGQRELFQDIGDSVRRQLAGEIGVSKTFRVEAGHGVGKTFGAAMLVNWFFDCFPPSAVPGSVTMTTAPTKFQVEELLWKDIKAMRPDGLPGRVLPGTPRMERAGNWWAIGRTTNDNGGKGSARFHGQHNEFFFVVLDEAEGVPDFVFNAVRGMMTGCRVVIVLMLANPQTRTSRFFKTSKEAGVRNYRLSVLDHPNVLDGRDTVPGATSREWVLQCVRDWCDVVPDKDEDSYTFVLPYDVTPGPQGEGSHGPPGTIFRPNSEFLFRVMGVAPANLSDATFIPTGRFEAACARAPVPQEPTKAWIGIDAAGYGNDLGTIYARHNGAVWRAGQCSKKDGDQDTSDYWFKTKRCALELKAKGAKTLRIRIDAGGGFGNGLYDRLKRDEELKAAFDGVDSEGRPNYELFLVNFGGSPKSEIKYRDLGTEMYAEAGESLKSLAVIRPPERLQSDLCERKYVWVNFAGREVRKLEEKPLFRRSAGHSPDDGDGFVLCVAPDFLFRNRALRVL